MRREWIGLAALIAVLAVVFGIYNGGESRRPKVKRAVPVKQRKVSRTVLQGLREKKIVSRGENRRNQQRKENTVSAAPLEAAPAEPPADPEARAPEQPILHPVDKDGVKAAIMLAAKDIGDCYRTLLADYPDMSGRIEMSFDIEDDGDHAAVKRAEVLDSSIDSIYLEGCAVTALEDVWFEPVGDEGASVTWPFVFRAED